MFTVEDPGHFVDKDVVQGPGIVILEDLDHVLDEFHVHVTDPASGAVEHQGHQVTVVLPVGKLSVIRDFKIYASILQHQVNVVKVGRCK